MKAIPDIQDMMVGNTMDLMQGKKDLELRNLLSRSFMAGAASLVAIFRALEFNKGENKEAAIALLMKTFSDIDAYCTVSIEEISLEEAALLYPAPGTQQ